MFTPFKICTASCVFVKALKLQGVEEFSQLDIMNVNV